MYKQLGDYYEQHELHLMNHARVTRYEILLDFIINLETGKEELFRELLTLDLYLRENVKNRPAFAGEYPVNKDFLNEFYELEAQQHHYLEGYEQYDKKQLRKMTHMEKFQYDVLDTGKRQEVVILFDYANRNKLTHQAKTVTMR